LSVYRGKKWMCSWTGKGIHFSMKRKKWGKWRVGPLACHPGEGRKKRRREGRTNYSSSFGKKGGHYTSN